MAADALGNLEGDNRGVVAALSAGLKDDDSMVRLKSAESLGRLGAAAESEKPVLLMVRQRDADQLVRSAADEALRSIENSEAEGGAPWLLIGLVVAGILSAAGWWIHHEVRAEQATRPLSRSPQLR